MPQIAGYSGAIRRGRLHVHRVIDVDTSQDPERARRLKAVWTRVAMERLERGEPGLFGYRLFAVSRSGLRRLRDLQLEYVRAMQAVLGEPQASECVGLYCAQLLDLETGAGNALAAGSYT